LFNEQAVEYPSVFVGESVDGCADNLFEQGGGVER
jgi:hypothetical protein